ncbi:transposase [Kitasatospora sp. NPDC003701]
MASDALDRIEPLTPAAPVHGQRRTDHRCTLEAIAWEYRTQSRWQTMPKDLGPFQGTRKRLLRQAFLSDRAGRVGRSDGAGWTASVGSIPSDCGRPGLQNDASRVPLKHWLPLERGSRLNHWRRPPAPPYTLSLASPVPWAATGLPPEAH